MYLGYRASLDWMALVAETVVARPGLAERGVTVFVIPSYPVLESAVRLLRPAGITVGAQDVSAGEGALTGEVSAGILAELGVGLVEVGHAERRRLFGETDAVVAAKTRAALAAGLTPLVCVGEAQRTEPAETVRVVVEQCLAAVSSNPSRLADIVVAYEPVWAIGAAEPAPAAYVNEVVAGIRAELAARSGAVAPPIVYGGSAGPGLLATLPEVDGLFLGRFAHDPANVALVLDEALAARTPVVE
jgi:triosephosphate isomerase